MRRRGAFGERNVTGRHGLPAVFLVRLDVSSAVPWTPGAGCAPSMRELNAGDGSVLVQEADYAREELDVLILIYAEVPIGDAAARLDSTCLEDDEPCPTDGTAAMVDEVPVGRKTVDAGVLAHGRDHDAVVERDIAHAERFEQVGGRR